CVAVVGLFKRSNSSTHFSGSTVLLGFLEEVAQAIEPALPDRAPIADPPLRHRKPLRLDAAGAHAADLFGAHQAALLEHLQVLDDGGESELQRVRKARHRYRSRAELLQNGAARGIAQGVEHAIDSSSLRVHATSTQCP